MKRCKAQPGRFRGEYIGVENRAETRVRQAEMERGKGRNRRWLADTPWLVVLRLSSAEAVKATKPTRQTNRDVKLLPKHDV